MIEEINSVKEQGFKPVIYIDSLVMNTIEMISLSKSARQCNVPVYHEGDTVQLERTRKAYVFSYGPVPQMTRAMIQRKGGKIVSGNLTVY